MTGFKKSTLKKDYIWNTIGVLLQNAVSPLLLLVVTRVNGIEAAGVFSFAFAVSILLWALGMWGGRTYQVSDVEEEFSTRSYIVTRVLLSIFVLILSGLFCYINNYDNYKTALIFSLVIFKIIESYADVIYGVIQKNELLYRTGMSLSFKAVIGIASFVIIDLVTNNLVLAVMGVVGVNILVFVIYDVPQAHRLESVIVPYGKVKFHAKEALLILKKTLNVFFVFFLVMVSLNIPRYFVDKLSPNEIGYFGIIVMPITLIVLVISFILQPNIIKLSNIYRGKNKTPKNLNIFKKDADTIVKYSLVIGGCVVAVTIVAGSTLLKWLFGVDFALYEQSLIIMTIGGVASSLVTVYVNLFVILRRVNFPLGVLILTNLILVPVSMFVVSKYKLIGGATVFAVASWLQVMLLRRYFNKICLKK